MQQIQKTKNRKNWLLKNRRKNLKQKLKNSLRIHYRKRKRLVPILRYPIFESKKYARILVIIRPNNFFYVYQNNVDKSQNEVICSEMLGMKVTKKTIKYNLFTFLNKVYPTINTKSFRLVNFVIVELNVPLVYRKKIIKYFKENRLLKKMEKKGILFNYKNSKTFNGCRAAKPKRLKRKRKFTLFK